LFGLLQDTAAKETMAVAARGVRNARGGEKIRQIRRFAESDKELARFYRENA
jgi:hypothetical protein